MMMNIIEDVGLFSSVTSEIQLCIHREFMDKNSNASFVFVNVLAMIDSPNQTELCYNNRYASQD